MIDSKVGGINIENATSDLKKEIDTHTSPLRRILSTLESGINSSGNKDATAKEKSGINPSGNKEFSHKSDVPAAENVKLENITVNGKAMSGYSVAE